MAGRRSMALNALARGGWGMNEIRNEPRLGCVAERTILPKVSLVHVLHLVAGDAVEQLFLPADGLV